MQNEIITFTSPKSSVSEVFRTLRTNAQFMTASNDRKSILFTSTQAGDGKSWIAANLAIAFAQAGKKVVLVDTDMRRGRQHKQLRGGRHFRRYPGGNDSLACGTPRQEGRGRGVRGRR